MILYCVRHGESVYNIEGRLQGQSNPRLSPLGQRQAEALADALGELPIDAIYASPLARAFDTAQPTARRLNLPISCDERLMEINLGIFQGLTPGEAGLAHPREAASWAAHDPDYRLPGGESRRELMHRASAAFNAIRQAAQRHVLVVSHGGLLAAVLKALLGVPAERNPFSLYNASLSMLRWDSQPQLLTLNQTDHLRAAACERTAPSGEV